MTTSGIAKPWGSSTFEEPPDGFPLTAIIYSFSQRQKYSF
jgi:hypothetical protein